MSAPMTPKRIREIRRMNRWLQKDLAKACGVSIRSVQGWENGRKPGGAAIILLEDFEKAGLKQKHPFPLRVVPAGL